jgi:hypothetical protein
MWGQGPALYKHNYTLSPFLNVVTLQKIGLIWSYISKVYLYSCTHWLGPATSPFPPQLGSYTLALLVSQDKRHLFVTPCFKRTL